MLNAIHKMLISSFEPPMHLEKEYQALISDI